MSGGFKVRSESALLQVFSGEGLSGKEMFECRFGECERV